MYGWFRGGTWGSLRVGGAYFRSSLKDFEIGVDGGRVRVEVGGVYLTIPSLPAL